MPSRQANMTEISKKNSTVGFSNLNRKYVQQKKKKQEACIEERDNNNIERID